MLNNLKIGFIGYGNMGKALANGLISSNKVDSKNIYVCDINDDYINEQAKALGFNPCVSNNLVETCDVIILAVKPNVIEYVLEDIKKHITNEKLIISIAAGVSISSIKNIIGIDKKVIRVMPNTPALVLEGMSSISGGTHVEEKDYEIATNIFSAVGKTILIDESLIDAVIGVSGSSPAFIFQIIEAMSDAGVMAGLTRKDALNMSAQAVLGSAKMVLETGMHPAQLKDMVTSPKGTTIEGVKAMEQSGVRAGIMAAVEAAINKSIKMSK